VIGNKSMQLFFFVLFLHLCSGLLDEDKAVVVGFCKLSIMLCLES